MDGEYCLYAINITDIINKKIAIYLLYLQLAKIINAKKNTINCINSRIKFLFANKCNSKMVLIIDNDKNNTIK